MQPSENKEVYFNEYCGVCKNQLLKEIEDPCNECLTEVTNINSHKPVKFEGR
jgi:hypothetical protein